MSVTITILRHGEEIYQISLTAPVMVAAGLLGGLMLVSFFIGAFGRWPSTSTHTGSRPSRSGPEPSVACGRSTCLPD